MIKLRLIQVGQPAADVTVEGDSVTVGRGGDCDVVINQPYISKRHAKILRGWVVVDLNSSNGTFVGDEQVREAMLLAGGRIRLSKEEVYLELDLAASEPGEPTDLQQSDARIAVVRDELEAARERFVRVSRELDELKARDAVAVQQNSAAVVQLERDNEDLRRRVASLRSELEARAIDVESDLGVKLADERLAKVHARNVELEKQVAKLEQASRSPSGEAQALHEKLRQRDAEIAHLRTELETSARAVPAGPAPAQGAVEMFMRLQNDNQELRKRVARLEGDLAAAAREPATAPSPSSKSESRARIAKDEPELKQKVAALEDELRRWKTRATAAAPAWGAPAAGPYVSGAAKLLKTLAETDIEGREPILTGPLEDFFALETFRFLRQVERVVTRMAGDFIQLYAANTMLPDVKGTLRELTKATLRAPNEPEVRAELVAYLEKLRKWLVVSLAAHKQGAERFAEGLKTELSEASLVAASPIPAHRRLVGQWDSELWKRAASHLKELTPDMVEDRLGKLIRAAAIEMIEKPEPQQG